MVLRHWRSPRGGLGAFLTCNSVVAQAGRLLIGKQGSALSDIRQLRGCVEGHIHNLPCLISPFATLPKMQAYFCCRSAAVLPISTCQSLLARPSSRGNAPAPLETRRDFHGTAVIDTARWQKVLGSSSLSRLPSQVRKGNKSARPRAVAAVAEPADAPPMSRFEGLGLMPELVTALTVQGLREPTEIQVKAISAILEGGDVLLASHTGSGKTLAYLLPVIQRLKNDEKTAMEAVARRQQPVRGALNPDGPSAASDADGADVSSSDDVGYTLGVMRPRHPRALVLTPTRELSDQVLSVAKSLSHFAKFRSAQVGGGGQWKQQKAALAVPLDLLVATPGRLLQHLEEGNLSLSCVRYLVLDEADTMFDQDFGPEVQRVIDRVKMAARTRGFPMECVLVAATVKKGIANMIAEKFPSMAHVKTSTLHKGVASARHNFITVPAGENRLDYLKRLVDKAVRKEERVMVFCNTVDSCRAVDHYLNDAGVETINYHGAVPAADRAEGLKLFRGGAKDGDEGGGDYDDDEEPAPKVLVCSDLAARGLDLQVQHIINFDFPLNPVREGVPSHAIYACECHPVRQE
eukprot:jgi/Mesvir1/25535/Mv01782-RA.2